MEKLDNIVMYSPEDVRKLLHLGNSKCLELESLKEVMRSDIYEKVVKSMVDPMENKRLKQQVKRLNRLLEAARDERDYYKDKCKGKKV